MKLMKLKLQGPTNSKFATGIVYCVVYIMDASLIYQNRQINMQHKVVCTYFNCVGCIENVNINETAYLPAMLFDRV